MKFDCFSIHVFVCVIKYLFVLIVLTGMPQEAMPVLEVDGKKIPQSRAIDRFLAREFGSEDILIIYYFVGGRERL